MDKLKPFVRTGEIEFRVMLNSKRLRRLLDEIWINLPMDVRQRLNESIRTVTDHRVLVDLLNGDKGELQAASISYLDRWLICLDAKYLQYKSDAYTRNTIAHELAHTYSNHIRELGNPVEETEANQLATEWGYPEVEK